MIAPTKPMSGWKMKAGSFMIAIAATLGGAAEIAPIPEMAPWIKFLAFIVAGAGAGFVAWGAGHKIEKNNKVLVKKKTVPYFVHPMSKNEVKLLEQFRKMPKPPESGDIS